MEYRRARLDSSLLVTTTPYKMFPIMLFRPDSSIAIRFAHRSTQSKRRKRERRRGYKRRGR